MPSQRYNRKRRVLKKRIRDAAQVVLDNLEGRKVGRPPEYHPGFCHLAEKCCALEATNPDLVDLLGTNIQALHDWQKQHPKFAEAIKRGKEKIDIKIEQSLAARARGYTHKSEKVFMTKKGRIVRAPILVHYPPSEVAQIFWLKNRQPARWKPDAQLQPIDGSTPSDLAAQLREQLAEIDQSTGGETPSDAKKDEGDNSK